MRLGVRQAALDTEVARIRGIEVSVLIQIDLECETITSRGYNTVKLHNLLRVICSAFLFLTCALSTGHAQSVSVPFPKGFIGTVGSSSGKADSILTFQTLGVVRGLFIQPSTNGQFGGTQGNDLSGTLRLILSNGSTIDIQGAMNWRDTAGSTLHAFGFIPNPANPTQTITYGSGSQLTLNSSSNYGLQVVGSSVIYSDGTSISGNAATNGLLSALNAYLGTVAASGPKITGPSGTAGAATSARTVNENQTAVTTLTADRAVTWAIFNGSDAARFSINSSGILTFNAPPDFEVPTDSDVNNAYVVVVQAIDTDGYSSQQTITVTVADLDDTAPRITGPSGSAGAAASAKSVPENQTAVHTFSANEAVTWSITGGADAARFSIVPGTGVLSFNVAPDFELPIDVGGNNIYDLVITATDLANMVSTQTVVITVTDLDEAAPVITGPSNAAGSATSAKSVPENQSAVHTFAASETVIWSISGGADAARFAIDPATGAVTFVAAPDFETPTDAGVDNIYDLIVTATDPTGNATTQTVAVTVTDLDDTTPVISGPSGAAGAVTSDKTIDEGLQAIHTFTSSETVTWTISGADAAAFSIDPASGALALFAAPDFEAPADVGANNVYNVTIVATDPSGNTTTQTVVLTIRDLDEIAPVITGPSGSAGASASAKSVAEGTLSIHTFTASEQVVWAITGGADGSLLSIDPVSGALTFVAGPDFELPDDADTNNVYLVVVSATDAAGNVTQQSVSITVTDAPEDTTAPVITGPSTAPGAAASAKTVNEGTTAVHSFTANEGVVWAVSGGTDAARFTINSATGALIFNAAPDFETPTDADTDNAYVVRISAIDGFGNPSEQTVTITVADVTEDTTPPVVTGPSGTTNVQAESVPEGETAVYVFTASEPVTWAVSGGVDGGQFSIDPATGTLEFLAPPDFAAPADADADNVYLVTVTATDAVGNVTTLTMSVTVTDTTSPVITGPSGAAGNATSAKTVDEGTVAVHSFTSNETVTWAITGGADAARLAIDPTNGALTFVTAPDFEAPTDADTNNVYLVHVTATDGSGNTSIQTVTVTVADVVENDTTPPVLAGPQAVTVIENQTAVSTYTADETVVWSVSGVDGARFAIDPASGVLTLVNAPDFEVPTDAGTDNVYNVILTATDPAGNATARPVAVTVANVAEDTTQPQVFGPGGSGTSQGLTVQDGVSAVATLTANEAVTWAISGGPDASVFAFDPTTGVLRFASPPAFAAPTDADADNVYVVVVRATDAAGNTTDVAIRITVIDPEVPTITGPSGLPGAETSATSVLEGSPVAARFTADRPLTWSIGGGTDAVAFRIDPATGELTFATPPDFEHPLDSNGDNIYLVIVQGTDANGDVSSQTVAITVTNAIDSTAEVAEAHWDDVARIIRDVELNHLRAGLASRQSMVRSARDRFIEAGKLREDCREIETGTISAANTQENTCDRLSFKTVPFDVDGWIEAGVNGLNGAGMFFGQTGNADASRRRIVSGEFQFVDDGNGIGTAEINGRVAWERLVTDREMLGYFVEGGISRTSVDRGIEGNVNKSSLAFGAYIVTEPVDLLYFEGFASLGFGQNEFALANDDLSLTGNYTSRSYLLGGALSGVIEREGYEIRPELSLAYGRTDIGGVAAVALTPGGTAEVLADIDGVNLATVRLTPEIIIPFDLQGIGSTFSFAPSLICEWSDDDQSCGGGLALTLRGQTDDTFTTYDLTVDADRISDVSRAAITLNLVHRF